MANLKQYTIQINGIEQSISAVDALNKQLDALEKKIDALQGKAVNAASTPSGGAGRTAELSDEDKLLKQIETTQSRINQADMADYKVLLDKKQELKELVTEQKSMTAEARLTEGAYANTMQGMKQHLADIKAAMQTVDLGDTDTFKKLTKDANELNQKLLEIEKSYGQFGRNVGNYPSAAEGFKGLKIQVGDTVAEFVNARQALRALKQEMQTLSTKKDMGIISEEEAERLKSLIPTVKQLESSIQDAGKPMDALMDNMQSFVALAQAGQGLAAFFGLEGTEIDETIKNLVALQNAMQGLQTIQKQLQTQEGFGKYFSKANSAIDAFVNKLFGVKNASNEAAKAEKVQATATTQLGNASKSATVAVKGLSMAIKAIGIGLLIGFVSKLVDAFSDLFKKSKESEEAIKGIDAAVAGLDRQTSKLMEKYDRLFDQGTITSAQRLAEQIKLQAEYTENLVEAMRQRQLMDENSKGVDFGDTIGDKNFFGISVRNIEDVKKEWKELQKSVLNGDKQTYLDALNAGKTSAEYWIGGFKSMSGELDDTSKEILNDFIGRTVNAENELKKALKDVENGVQGARERVKKAQQTIKDLEDEMNSDKILNSILANMDKLIPDEKVRKACMNILESLGMITKGIEEETTRTNKRFHDLLIGLLPEQEQALARAKEQYGQDLEAFKDNLIGKTLATLKYKKEVDRINSSGTTSSRTTGGLAKSEKNKLEAVKKAQENINELTLKLMSEGLYKELKKLDENNRKEIDKIKKNGERVEEQLRLQYKVYEKEQNELFDKYINDIEKRNASLSLQNEIDEVKVLKEQWENIHLVMNRPTSTKDSPLYGLYDTQDDVKKLIEQYESWSQLYDIRNDELSKNNWEGYFEALKKDYLPKAAKEIQDEFNRLLEAESPEQAYNYLKKEFENETSELKYFLTKYQGTIKIGENEISQILEDSYLERISLTTERFRNFIDVENKYINESLRLEKERIDNEEQLEKDANEKRLDNAREGFEKLINESQKYSGYTPTSVAELLRGKEEKDLSDEEKNLQKFVKLIDAYEKEATQITNKYANQRKAAELDANIQRQNNNYRYYEQTIANLEDYIQKASSIVDKQPEVNKLGFINLKKTREQYKEVLDMYKHMSEDIKYTIVELLQEVNTGKISGEQFETAMNNLEFYKKKLEENVKDINEKTKQHFQEFLSTINEWLQQVGQAANSIMSSLSEITSNKYEEMIDQQQKYIDEYSDLLDKQKDKTQEYADAVKGIEDELSSARGDRRQQLIDNLNAEMAAQRASLAQEKKIEKEREKAERKKSELEYQQALAEKKMSVAQAALNAVMAVSMAAVNKWPIPAIPMMALAAAVGAAQVAAANSQYIPKPSYGDGGVIVGKSHKEGGVPVLGGRAEVEGGEFITNKVTTAKNVGLLEYINSKRRKVDIADLLEFYNSGRPSNSIASVRTRFADGGVIPQLRTDISFNDRLITAFEDYSNRPQYVQVVDIIDQTERLNEVKVISGLEV